MICPDWGGYVMVSCILDHSYLPFHISLYLPPSPYYSSLLFTFYLVTPLKSPRNYLFANVQHPIRPNPIRATPRCWPTALQLWTSRFQAYERVTNTHIRTCFGFEGGNPKRGNSHRQRTSNAFHSWAASLGSETATQHSNTRIDSIYI